MDPINTSMWTEIDSCQGDMKTVTKTRLYPACHSGDSQAVNTGSHCVHINLQYKYVDGGKGKMDEDIHAR